MARRIIIDMAVAIALSLAAAGCSDDGTNPTDPAPIDPDPSVTCGLIGRYSTPGFTAADVAVSGSHAYVVGAGGLRVINISDPALPTLVGSYHSLSDTLLSVTTVGNLAYVGDAWGVLEIINVSNPSAPTKVGSCSTSGDAIGVVVAGNYAYLTNWALLQIVDISDPSSPTLIGSYRSIYCLDVCVLGNYAYVAGSLDAGLQIINISSPSSPSLAGSEDCPGLTMGVSAVGHYAYVTDTSGLRIIDVSNPASPTPAGRYNSDMSEWGRVTVVGQFAYVTDDNSLQIIDVSNPGSPTLAKSYSITGGVSLGGPVVVGNRVFLTAGEEGLQIFRVCL